MRTFIRIFFIAVISYLLGLIAVMAIRSRIVHRTATPIVPTAKPTKIPPGISRAPTFSPDPPQDTITGSINMARGTVEKRGRNDTEFKVASAGAVIVDGEKVRTGEDSGSVVSFGPIGTFSMNQNTEVAFISLFPQSFVMDHSRGTVMYDFRTAIKPVSIHVLRAVILFTNAQGIIELDDDYTTATVSLKQGQAKIGIIDLTNTTQITHLEPGDTALIDDTTRVVSIQ